MPVSWIKEMMQEWRASPEKYDYSNTKEDYEVLYGLFIGVEMYEDFTDFSVVKRVRLYDTLL